MRTWGVKRGVAGSEWLVVSGSQNHVVLTAFDGPFIAVSEMANHQPLRENNLASANLMDSYPAPPFPEGLDWINTAGRALTLQDLRGKLVLLDFWTYG